MLFGPHQNPRAMLTCKLTSDLVRSIMVTHALVEIICVTDIETALWISENINPKHQELASSGRIRTYDQSVNSRPLYH